MRSSVAAAGRALIMLACVVGIPALALSSTSWPEVMRKLEDLHWRALLGRVVAFASDAGAPAPAAGRDSATPVQAATPNRLCQEAPLGAVVPAGYQEPTVARPGPASADRSFESVEQRLRQLGATYYLLESWGSGRQLYRFFCKMAVGGSAEYTRCFEATEADPLQAMTGVLRQVENWRGGGVGEGLGARSETVRNSVARASSP
jgi:hypothetical protein